MLYYHNAAKSYYLKVEFLFYFHYNNVCRQEAINIKKSNIHDIKTAYKELFRDLGFKVDNDVVIAKNSISNTTASFSEEHEFEHLFEDLAIFAITEEDMSSIISRYGLKTGIPVTLQQLAKNKSVSAESIRININSSLRKLKHHLNVSRTLSRIGAELSDSDQ